MKPSFAFPTAEISGVPFVEVTIDGKQDLRDPAVLLKHGCPVWDAHLRDAHVGHLAEPEIVADGVQTAALIDLPATSPAHQKVIDSARKGEKLEVSVGAYTFPVFSSGNSGGEAYYVIRTNITPHHLAIIPDGQKGACSLEDGCGLGQTNAAANAIRRPNFAGTESKAWPSVDREFFEVCAADSISRRAKSGVARSAQRAVAIGRGEPTFEEMDPITQRVQ